VGFHPKKTEHNRDQLLSSRITNQKIQNTTEDSKLYQRDEAAKCKLKVETVSCRRRPSQIIICLKKFGLEVKTAVDGSKLHKNTPH
jgi:hypothetical protein